MNVQLQKAKGVTVYPNSFEYHRPNSVKDAAKILDANPDAKIIAGGHSLLPAMKLRLANPAALVDIARIPGLSEISVDGAAKIGAMVTYQQLLDHKGLRKAFPVIAEATNLVGDPAVRARGTIGGSLAHADPAADLTAVMLALNANVLVTGAKKSRKIDIDDFFKDLLTTSLNPDEIITEIEIPAASGAGMAYEKHAHPASGYAVVGIAVKLEMAGGKCKSARVAVTGSGAKATRATATEMALQGKELTAATIAAAAAMAANDLGELNSDVYASAEYRAHLTRVLARRGITRAAGK